MKTKTKEKLEVQAPPVGLLQGFLETLQSAAVPLGQRVEGLDQGVLQFWVRALCIHNLLWNILKNRQLIRRNVSLRRTIISRWRNIGVLLRGLFGRHCD